MVLGCYYLTLLKKDQKGEGRIFSSKEEALIAFENKEIDLHAHIHIRLKGLFMNLSTYYDDQDVLTCPVKKVNNELVGTTPGRIIFNDIFPDEIPFVNGKLKKKGLESLVYYNYLKLGRDATVEVLDDMKEIGFKYASSAGFSLGINDFVTPPEKSELVNNAQKEVQKIESLYQEGVISARERFNRVVGVWGTVTDKVSQVMIDDMQKISFESNKLNPLFVMADSGSRGNKQQIRQLAGMRGLMSKPSGEIIETPIISNLREGLNVLQYFISTHGARKGLADTALKTANSGYLTRKLVDVSQEVIVDEHDCGTLKGVQVSAIVENGELIEPFVDRIVGRTALEKVTHPDSNEVIVDVNEEITEDIAQSLESLGIEQIKIRSVLTCESKRGVCQLCYGRDMATGETVELGEAVGVQAAQSIGEPGTQLTMRTFHVGGIAMGGAEKSRLEAKNDGFIKFDNLNYVINKNKKIIVVNRNARIAVLDHRGREIEHYQVPYGAQVLIKDGEEVKERQQFAEWDPFNTYIISEETGRVHFHDVVLGITMEEIQDEFTGLITQVITDPKDDKMQPQIMILDEKKKDDKGKPVLLKKYFLPSGANLEIKDDDKIFAGDILAKIPREATRTKDITGGLPRAEELFEARRPKAPATISEIDGVVSYGGLVRGNRKIIVENERGGEKEYFIPKEAHVIVGEKERVKAGTPLMDGPVNPHDILRVLGEKELAEYLLREVQGVYRLQGVAINDKHMEVVIRQMLRWVKVEEVGDTDFIVDEKVDKFVFQEQNRNVIEKGGKPAKARPLLLGITKSALSTSSFIAAASFQETTRVLTEASLYGKIDHLRRLKENIIMGRLIPAGTGYKAHQRVELAEEKEEKKEEEVDLQISH